MYKYKKLSNTLLIIKLLLNVYISKHTKKSTYHLCRNIENRRTLMESKTDSKTLKQYLKELRKTYNYSQEFIASHLNITRQTYSHYETGRVTPPINSLYNLAKLYGTPVESFLDLVVTYEINMDFAKPLKISNDHEIEDMNAFIEFMNVPLYQKKCKFLDQQERRLLFYFISLSKRDKQDILSFLKIKYESREDK